MTRSLAIALVLPLLASCSGSFSIPPQLAERPRPDPQPQSAPLVETDTGETPTICYVRARGFSGLVPLGCHEATLARP